MEELLTLLYRTTILWVVALVVFRVIGKRTLAKLGPFDFAVIIMIGEPIITLDTTENLMRSTYGTQRPNAD